MESHDNEPAPPPRLRRGKLVKGVLKGFIALGLMALGAVGSSVVSRYTGGRPSGPVATAPRPLEPPATSAVAPGAPVVSGEVFLSPEAVAQAGIKTAEVTVIEPSVTIQLPGSVTADAYREVRVVPIVSGIIARVHVELGAAVKRGAPLATVFSVELAEAQTKYLSMRAMLEADHQRLQRTRQLVEIGAASRQEMEEITAIHASHATEAEAARQRLFLLGLSRAHVEGLSSPRQVVSEVVVPSPISGILTGRSANPGQVVSMGQELFVVTDLSQVWAIGDLYEQDFQAVREGSKATITTPAYPDLTLRGRVSYIDPRVDPQTRTAKARVEVPNPEGRLRLGMYVTMAFTPPSGNRLVVVPRSAIQAIGDRHVVFLPVADEAGKFVARTVQIGPLHGELSTILAGLQPGEVVVTTGSFFLRAELLRHAAS